MTMKVEVKEIKVSSRTANYMNSPVAVTIYDQKMVFTHVGVNINDNHEFVPAPLSNVGRGRDEAILARDAASNLENHLKESVEFTTKELDAALKRIERLTLSMKSVAMNLRNGSFTATMNASELEAAIRDVSEKRR